MAAEHAIPRAYGAYEDLLADPQLDAVYVALPNSLHAEWTIHAARAGKHVLCEKPLARQAADAERMAGTCRQAGVLLMEAFMWRHHPQAQALVDAVHSGRIGELRHVVARFSFMLERRHDIRLDPGLDGGSLMDVGAFCVNGSRLLAGEPSHVTGIQIVGPTGVDVRFTGALEFAGGVTGEFHCAFDVPYASVLEAVGSAGRVVVREPWLCIDPHLEIDGERVDVPDDDRYKLQLENFAAAVRGERQQLLGREDAVGQARTIDALYRSAASGAVVSL
jgi:predicted dehydrogenase